MKRFLLLLFFVLNILGANAQIYLVELKNGITAEGTLAGENDSTIRLKVKDNIRVFYKDDIKKFSMLKLEQPNTLQTRKSSVIFSKEHYQHEATLGYSLMFSNGGMLNVNYIGGFHLNDYVFIGFGTGLDFSFYSFQPMAERQEDYWAYAEIKPHNYKGGGWETWDSLPMQVVAVPIYAHIRTYFLNGKRSPFLGVSGGMRVSIPKKLYVYDRDFYDELEFVRTSKYGAVTGMFEIMVGIRRKINDKISMTYQCGYAMRSCCAIDGYCFIESQQMSSHGFSLKIGASF